MAEEETPPILNIKLPEDLDRNCPDCGVFMEAQVLVDIKEGAEEIKKVLQTCPSNTCDLLQQTRRWP